MKPASLLIPLALAALPGGVPAGAPDPQAIVDEAFAALDNDYRRHWAFTETTSGEDRTWIGRYDPRLPPGERWSLLSVDGRAPSDAERGEWASGRNEPDGRKDDQPADADIVSPDSLVLLGEDATRWRFGFRPSIDDEDEDAREFMAQVDGTLVVRKDGRWLEELRLTSAGPIRPATGVKISRFETELRFGRAAPVVLLAVDVHVKGRALLAIAFEEQERVRYGDYQLVLNDPAVPVAEDALAAP
jgi:hypothetical protein